MALSNVDVHNLEHDSTAKAKKVLPVDSEGFLIGNGNFITAIAYVSGTDNPEYIGLAKSGTSKSSAGWQIKKITYSGDKITDIHFADGETSFTKIWDNRASYSYS